MPAPAENDFALFSCCADECERFQRGRYCIIQGSKSAGDDDSHGHPHLCDDWTGRKRGRNFDPQIPQVVLQYATRVEIRQNDHLYDTHYSGCNRHPNSPRSDGHRTVSPVSISATQELLQFVFASGAGGLKKSRRPSHTQT
jgi:hypothetical protein